VAVSQQFLQNNQRQWGFCLIFLFQSNHTKEIRGKYKKTIISKNQIVTFASIA
jgi:hypothetical protein